ncbi:MAG: hypothetical protein V1484_01715 [bacterium]
MEIILEDENRKVEKQKKEPIQILCFYCGGIKKKGVGFGADYFCLRGCGSTGGMISSFNK